MYQKHDEIFTFKGIDQVLDLALYQAKFVKKPSKKLEYLNIPIAFDIETSSFYHDEAQLAYHDKENELQKNPKYNPEKIAIMYVWQMSINGYIVMGRKWADFKYTVDRISQILKLHTSRRIIIYVHNLAYEFQFFRKIFTWEKIFAVEERQPLYAVTDNGIEFRCSYMLSGVALSSLSEYITTPRYQCAKLVGNLNYDLIRHSDTPLSDAEIQYCVNDVLVVTGYIQQCIDTEGDITKVPLTNTGRVRKFCRNNCLYLNIGGKRKNNIKYRQIMNNLTLNDIQEFNELQRAFCGGFTHANAIHVGKVLTNIASYDFTSSYPSVIVAEKYPMSRGRRVVVHSLNEFNFYISHFLCVFDIQFKGIITKINQENYISISKCWVCDNPVNNNGRLVSADKIITTLTNIDFDVIRHCYTWLNISITNLIVYHADYLPTEFINCVLSLYNDKTTLKGVKDKENEYMLKKGMLNSCYGMAVTNPIRDSIDYDNNAWSTKPLTNDECMDVIAKYNLSKNRFLFYPWGVFVTAYARRNLWDAIVRLKDDYVYSDTDSVKILNYERHKEYFETYNVNVTKKLLTACKYHGINPEMIAPHNIHGEPKPLGVWDFEGVYTHFKTLGAKRYMTEVNNNINLTVAGVNKHTAVPYLIDTFGSQIFEQFNNFLQIPPRACGKNLHTYIDYEQEGICIDYLGNECKFLEKSSVHLEPTSYNLSLTVQYLQYLQGIKAIKYFK